MDRRWKERKREQLSERRRVGWNGDRQEKEWEFFSLLRPRLELVRKEDIFFVHDNMRMELE